MTQAAPAVDYERLLTEEGLGAVDSWEVAPRVRHPRVVEPEGAAEMERRHTLLAEHDFRGTHMGPTSSVRPRRDRAIYRLHADGWTQLQIARRYHISTRAVRRALQRIERAYAQRKVEGPTREMLTRFAREADPGLVALVFMLLERTLEQPEAGREILRTARDIPELRGLLDDHP